jgi:transposase
MEFAFTFENRYTADVCSVDGYQGLDYGVYHGQAAKLFGVNEDSVSRWVRRFNERGIDGITEGPCSGRRPKISAEQTDGIRDLLLHPEKVSETHWTGRKFHGYLTNCCQWRQGTAR